jgi:hypothetical protein
LTGPKDGTIVCIRFEVFVIAIEFPYLSAIVIKVIPPSQPYQQPACDILDSPKINSTQQDDNDECINLCKEVSNDKISEIYSSVHEKCCNFEGKGEHTGEGVRTASE